VNSHEQKIQMMISIKRNIKTVIWFALNTTVKTRNACMD